MSHALRIIAAAIVVSLAGMSSQASAHERLYPLTRCGPDLGYLCRIGGFFNSPPFHYNVAIYPGCIKTIAVQTPYGVERRQAVVCGTPQREMIWW